MKKQSQTIYLVDPLAVSFREFQEHEVFLTKGMVQVPGESLNFHDSRLPYDRNFFTVKSEAEEWYALQLKDRARSLQVDIDKMVAKRDAVTREIERLERNTNPVMGKSTRKDRELVGGIPIT